MQLRTLHARYVSCVTDMSPISSNPHFADGGNAFPPFSLSCRNPFCTPCRPADNNDAILKRKRREIIGACAGGIHWRNVVQKLLAQCSGNSAENEVNATLAGGQEVRPIIALVHVSQRKISNFISPSHLPPHHHENHSNGQCELNNQATRLYFNGYATRLKLRLRQRVLSYLRLKKFDWTSFVAPSIFTSG